ncbi:hypothetical protein SADUNF_Sadunf19G0014600 [Salix dunnii]|uniref:non-specific serine/threonine protein kinase n=1 Tax=Salix dunnii TaxID=1413687 RepID=A0A835J0I6_9ROSI|nr:hypothetical protein SADUNF_Sadunf19G0014600 [Salix dunnii]
MSILRMNNSVLYTEARLTPLSLTYYIPCLGNGNYTVKLHFAEIVIRGNRSYYSLGRRVFDVYIQNIVVLKDFDIVTKARGVDKVYIHNYTALVTNGALEIRLHWAGKGTVWSPETGTYGPLISAIDVESGRLTYNGMTCYEGEKEIHYRWSCGFAIIPHFHTFILSLVERLFRRKEIEGSRNKGNPSNEAGLAYKADDMWLPWIRVSPSMAVSLKDYPLDRGYMAPEYALYGYLTYKADVYSFGVVALEIVSGMNNAKFRRGENFVCLLDWVLYLQKNRDIIEMVDPRLGSAFNKKEVVRMINVALLCTNQSPTLRPTMSTVVSMLEGKTDVEELVMVPSTLSDQSGYATTLCNKFAEASFSGSSSENKSLVKSFEGPWTASSSSSA